MWGVASASPAVLAALSATISAFVALVTAITAPFLSIYIAKKQIRATVISNNRQAWINALRDDIAEMLELASAHFYLRNGTLPPEEEFKYGYEQRSRLCRLHNRIRLRLNANETPNQELLLLLGRVRTISITKTPDGARDLERDVELAIVKAQEILRAEWLRVRTGR